MLPGFTLPPYWMRTASAVVGAVELARARPGSPRWSSLASSRRRVASGADRPDRLVGDDARGRVGRLHAGERRPRSGSAPAPRSRPPPAPRASRPRTRSASSRASGPPGPSGSPSRRSRRTADGAPSARRSRSCTLSLASIGGLTSPVNAPSSSQWQFCAPSAIGMRSVSMRRLHRAEVGERRAHHHVARLVVGLVEAVRELLHALDRDEVVVVHLPVARDDRLALRSCTQRPCSPVRLAQRARGRGGRRCSMSSSDAPPPVLTWSTRSASPNWRMAAALSPPPITVNAVDSRRPPRRRCGCRRRTAPARTRPSARSRARCGASVTTSANMRRGLGADVEALPAVRDPAAPTRCGSSASADDRPARSRRRPGSAPGRCRAGAGTRRPCRARTSESPTPMPCASEERERHRAADEDRVAAVEQRVDHAELVAHLGAAEHRHERPGRGVVPAAARAPRPRGTAAGPPARGRIGGGPTIDACARCDAPNASFT